MEDGNILSGATALVTGGASGIGLATARMMARHGAIVACLDLDPAPTPLTGFYGDVSQDSVADVVTEAAETMGGLDIVVNNAGIPGRGTIESVEFTEWRQIFEVNVFGMVRIAKSALPWLRASAKNGRNPTIINTCSAVAAVGVPSSAPYAASKGAIRSLTLAMAADYVREGIRVNCILPGPVNTPWVRRLVDAEGISDAELMEQLDRRQPNGRIIEPEEVAACICYLASPAAASITGASVPIDGGLLGIRRP
jgi:2-keto-3-deoxy-L-fuconate dehydrogenase